MQCKGCQKEFAAKTKNQRFCSAKCKWAYNNAVRSLKPNVFYTCDVCGKEVAKYNSPSSFPKNAFRFCSRQCKGKALSGERHPLWNGGIQSVHGYLYAHMPDHPSADYKGRVRVHRLTMEQHIGRYLTDEEVVHHINEDVSDNRIENLMLFANHAEHKKWEDRHRSRDGFGRFEKKVQNV